jgi:hypothetical protein
VRDARGDTGFRREQKVSRRGTGTDLGTMDVYRMDLLSGRTESLEAWPWMAPHGARLVIIRERSNV